MTTRRALLSRLALVAVGGAGLWSVRDRLPWPPLQPRFANGRDTPWLPFEGRGDLIDVPVTIAGQRLRAVVDSGAQFSAIDAALAQRLGAPKTAALPILAYGVSGGPSLTHTVSLDLSLPGLHIAGVHAAALDLAEVSRATGRDFRLLIGRDVLRRLIVESDFSRHRARFLIRDAFRPPRDARIVPLVRKAGAPTARVTIENAAPIDVLVDTGASGVLAVSEDAARQVGLLAPGRPVSQAHAVGVNGFGVNQLVTARTVTVEGLTLRNVDVQIYRPAARAPAPSGLLGAGLFRRFRMALDLAGDRLYLTPPSPLIIVPAT